MPIPVSPTVEPHASFLAAMEEFAAEGRGPAADNSVGGDLRGYRGRWHDPAVFAAYVNALRSEAVEETPRRETIVPQTTLWYVESATYPGRISIRHRPTPALRAAGGHVGYDLRPSARRRGHATAMLAEAPPVARELGITSVLITCDPDDTASPRVIRANGGVPEQGPERQRPEAAVLDSREMIPHG